MPIVHQNHSFNDAESCVVYIGSQSVVPEVLDRNFVETLKKHSNLSQAYGNTCGAKAEYLAERVERENLGQSCAKLIMFNWHADDQPSTPYQSRGFTTGASYHALAFFVKDGLFIAVDLNMHPTKRTPYLEVYASESNEKLLKLLNAVYAAKQLSLVPVHAAWWDIFEADKSSKLVDFDKLHSLDDVISVDEQPDNPGTGAPLIVKEEKQDLEPKQDKNLDDTKKPKMT